MVTSLRSGSLCLLCVCPKDPPATGIEPGNSKRKQRLGVRGRAILVEGQRGSGTAQVQRRYVVNDRQLAVLRSTPFTRAWLRLAR
jgi:hypothetical protein